MCVWWGQLVLGQSPGEGVTSVSLKKATSQGWTSSSRQAGEQDPRFLGTYMQWPCPGHRPVHHLLSQEESVRWVPSLPFYRW